MPFLAFLAPFVFAATATPAPYTLAGITLGASLPEAIARDPATQHVKNSTGSGTLWNWTRAGLGAVNVVTDEGGSVTRIDFVATASSGTIDLPCLSGFQIDGSHMNLQFGMEETPCKIVDGSMSRYNVPGGSILEVTFKGPGDGGLAEAIWFRP